MNFSKNWDNHKNRNYSSLESKWWELDLLLNFLWKVIKKYLFFKIAKIWIWWSKPLNLAKIGPTFTRKLLKITFGNMVKNQHLSTKAMV